MSDGVFDRPLDIPSGDGPLPDIDWNEFKKVVETRRSVRVFDRTPVPEADVREALDLALLAPNSSNLQPWEFHWVRTPKLRKALVEACLSQPAARTAAELIVCVARTDTWPAMRARMLEAFAAQKNVPASAVDYYRKLVPMAYAVGPFGLFARLRGLAAFCLGFIRPVPREPSSAAELTTWAVKSTALACENLMLALRARGWDSCPMEGADSRRVKKLLGLPRSSALVMVVAAGRRSSRGVYGPRIRFDRALFVKER
ncbi:MAG TPA: nitroreductase family protein [Elusimicrobiota bacterium]|jgi:nitroreductase|nr:nitroreductase family protein [Elusimicrobiota bacterium]